MRITILGAAAIAAFVLVAFCLLRQPPSNQQETSR